MAILDIILLLCFVPAIVLGISKGFIKQLIGLVAIFAGAWIAFRFSSTVTDWLANHITVSRNVLHIISFIVIVSVATLILNLLGEMLTRVIKIMTLGWLNRLLGLVFSILKTALIIGLVIILFEGLNNSLHIFAPEKLENAVVYSSLRDAAAKVFPYLKSFITGINV